MLRLFLFCLLLGSQQLVLGQYPVILPHFLFEEMGKMDLEVPRLQEQKVSSKYLPNLRVFWESIFWEWEGNYPLIDSIETQATLTQVWNRHRQVANDTSTQYNYYELKENPIEIPEGFYKLKISSKARLTYMTLYSRKTISVKTIQAYPMEQWIYISKEYRKPINPYYRNRIIVLPNVSLFEKQVLEFFPRPTPPPSLTQYSTFSTAEHSLNNNHLLSIDVLSNDKNVAIPKLEQYFKEKYPINCPQQPNVCVKSDFFIDIASLDSIQTERIFNEIENCDTLRISSYHVKWFSKDVINGHPSLGGYQTPMPYALQRKRIKIQYFPAGNLYTLKKKLRQVGFTNIQNAPKGDVYYLTAEYQGTFHLKRMNKLFKSLFEEAHISQIQMNCF